ncbi:hypothetical protein [Erwinia mallotivora]|nr:hypothetical protein [Erwinia mallotivora]
MRTPAGVRQTATPSGQAGRLRTDCPQGERSESIPPHRHDFREVPG